MNQALRDAQEGNITIHRAAVHHNVNYETLRKFAKDPSRKFDIQTRKLTAHEEDELFEWIDECAKRGHPRSIPDILNAAFKLVKRRGEFNAQAPGRSWFALFKRRKQLKMRKAEIMTRASGNITKSNILKWFDEIWSGLEKDGLIDLLSDPKRIYNADESYFILNPTSGNVIVPKSMKNVFELVKDHKSGLTVMLSIRADGHKGKPFIIYPNERIPASINDNFPHEKATMAASDSGWMKSETFCVFLQALAKQAEEEGVKLPEEKILLFVDNHSSHITIDSCQLAKRLGIEMVSFYPNVNFLYQPADKTCFRSLKNHWKKEVRDVKVNDLDKSINKAEFSSIFMKAFEKLEPEVIKNGFESCGIYPWNCEAIDYSKCLGKTTYEEPAASDDTIVEDSFSLDSTDIEFHEDLSIARPEIDLEDETNASIITVENMWKVLHENIDQDTANDMLREFFRQMLNSILPPSNESQISAEEDDETNFLDEPELEAPSIEILHQIDDDCILTLPPIPERQNKRNVEKTSSILTFDENIGRLENKKLVQKQLEDQKKARLDERIAKTQKKLEDDAVRLAKMQEKSCSLLDLSQQSNRSAQKATRQPKKATAKRPTPISVEESNENSTVEPPVKRKRGRPRKVLAPIGGSNAENVIGKQ